MKKILIVEDEIITAMLFKTKFNRAGYYVCPFASTAEKAIEIFIDEKPDIIIMDIHLAGDINGIELSKILNKKIKCIIIFVTGYTDEKLKKEALKIKPFGYFIKPFDIEMLIEKMKKNIV